jgi:hypothetical protein
MKKNLASKTMGVEMFIKRGTLAGRHGPAARSAVRLHPHLYSD